jgi:hypothetical protein
MEQIVLSSLPDLNRWETSQLDFRGLGNVKVKKYLNKCLVHSDRGYGRTIYWEYFDMIKQDIIMSHEEEDRNFLINFVGNFIDRPFEKREWLVIINKDDTSVRRISVYIRTRKNFTIIHAEFDQGCDVTMDYIREVFCPKSPKIRGESESDDTYQTTDQDTESYGRRLCKYAGVPFTVFLVLTGFAMSQIF